MSALSRLWSLRPTFQPPLLPSWDESSRMSRSVSSFLSSAARAAFRFPSIGVGAAGTEISIPPGAQAVAPEDARKLEEARARLMAGEWRPHGGFLLEKPVARV